VSRAGSAGSPDLGSALTSFDVSLGKRWVINWVALWMRRTESMTTRGSISVQLVHWSKIHLPPRDE
jgi:hypothetical protein